MSSPARLVNFFRSNGLLLALALAATSLGSELAPAAETTASPPLNLPDLAGQIHDLETYRGQAVLVNFWTTWCTPCLVEMPGMQRLSAAMEDRPFTILAVNVHESKEKVWRFRNVLDVDFTTLLDQDGSAAREWAIETYPTSFLIDDTGDIRHTFHGALEWDSKEVRALIEALMPDRKTFHQAQSAAAGH